MFSINVLLTTIGRETLGYTLRSLVSQLQAQDYLTVISDDNHKDVSATLSLFTFKCTIIHISNPIRLGWWGHESRNKYQNCLMGDFIMNADDDNVYTEGAFDKIRETVIEDRLYIFRFENEETIVWDKIGVVEKGNIDTSCGVIPNTHHLPKWETVYGGDGLFYQSLCKMIPYEFVDFKICKTIGDDKR